METLELVETTGLFQPPPKTLEETATQATNGLVLVRPSGLIFDRP